MHSLKRESSCGATVSTGGSLRVAAGESRAGLLSFRSVLPRLRGYAVANSWVTQELIPDTGMMTLADLINLVSTSLILLTILISILSLHLQETFGQQPLSKSLDRGCFLLLAPGYLLFQILVSWFAAG